MIPEFELAPRHSDDSISLWLGQVKQGYVKQGQERPVAKLLARYFPRLVALASSRLRGQPRLLAYAEDVALSVFHTLCHGAERGRFPDLSNRRSLWQLLAVMTVRKTIDLQRKQNREQPAEPEHLGSIACSTPSPAAAAQSRDRVNELLGRLDEPVLRQIVEWKVAGFANEEIAAKLKCNVRTVERKLGRIRTLWQTSSQPCDIA